MLHALAKRHGAAVVVASAAALLTKVPEPAALLLSSCEIKPGVDLDPHELANTLVMGGYEAADPVDAHGEFGRRGGIFDVFPAGEELPIRIEFIGDSVESVRRFDPGTQRSVETLDRFGIVPVREAQPELLGVWHLYMRICSSSCVRATRRYGCLSQPMWKTTSRRPGSRSATSL